MEKFDSIVIGFGKAGKTLAGFLAQKGEKVALIEKSKGMYGGTCINVGCIPTKSLVYSSENKKDYKTAVLEKNAIITKLRQKNYEKLASNPNITIINGNASFVSENIISVDNEKQIEGSKIFINTGSKSFIPNIDGIKDNKIVYTSDTLLNLETLPKNLVVIGGGYIGLEFASIYSNFGSNVTILQDIKEFLPREDKEISDAILKTLEKRGINVIFGAKTEKINENSVTFSVDNEKQEITADAVLIATGRRPDTKDLNLQKANIETLPNGAVKVDETLKTSVPHIYAMGDVTGGLQFTYISLDDFRIVKSQLFENGKRTTNKRGVIPYTIFITPPFSRTGLTEQEAIEQGYDIKIAKILPASHPKAIILRNTDGLLKVIIDAKTDKILGAHIFCEESHEMINLFKLAMDNQIPYTTLKDNIYNHPVMTEILNDLFAGV